MAVTVWPVNAVTGAPAYSGRMYRQIHSAILTGATAARPLGARSGVRPGTPTTTVTATSTVWTVKPHSGIIDAQTAVEAGPYWYAIDANVTGAVTAAHATLPRKDIVYIRIDDPAESDGSSVPVAAAGYLAGTAAGSPAAPATPARSMVLAEINVPASGGGSPTVTFTAPVLAAAGGIVQVRTLAELTSLGAAASADSPIYADYDGGVWRKAASTWMRVGRGDGLLGEYINDADIGALPGVATDYPIPGSVVVTVPTGATMRVRVVGRLRFWASAASQVGYLKAMNGVSTGAAASSVLTAPGATTSPTGVTATHEFSQLLTAGTYTFALVAGSNTGTAMSVGQSYLAVYEA